LFWLLKGPVCFKIDVSVVLNFLFFSASANAAHWHVSRNSFFTGASEKVRAKFNFDATSDKQLSLKAGDIISVVEKHASGWFKGECNGAVGLFPSNYTEPLT
jgi:hypothetical protein